MIKILVLYNELLDLYGDSGNIKAITYQLDFNAINYKVDYVSLYDDIDFDNYDLFYIGPGKDKNVIEISKHILKYKQQINQAIDNGKIFLVFGNAQLLFSKEIIDIDNSHYQCLGIIDAVGKITGQVFINDYICTTSLFDGEVFGFINRTSLLENICSTSLFKVTKSQKDIGNDEGVAINNFFASWALGPLLAKNPNFLKFILIKLTNNENIKLDDSLMNIAQQKTISDFM